MVLSAKYSKDGFEKIFYIDYRLSHTHELVYPYWKKKFEDLNFVQLDKDVFKEAFNTVSQFKDYISDHFNLTNISLSK